MLHSDIKEGVAVICKTDRLKHFSKGSVYIIETIYFNRYSRNHIDKIKLKGIKGSVSHRNFEPVGKDFIRDLSIAEILGEDPSHVITTEPTTNRKIDEVDNKEYQLFELLMNRFARDRNGLPWIKSYNNFDSMVKTISMGDKIWGIKEEDFDCIKNMTISDLMNLFIKYRQNPKNVR